MYIDVVVEMVPDALYAKVLIPVCGVVGAGGRFNEEGLLGFKKDTTPNLFWRDVRALSTVKRMEI